MQQARITPERLAEAVTRLGPTLQGMLTSPEWTAVQGLVQTVQSAGDERARRLAGVELIDWLAAHPAVSERVHLELTLLEDLRAELEAALAQEADRLGLPAAGLDGYVEAVLRGVQPEVTPGEGEVSRQVFVTPGRATSVHLRNVWLHPGELLEFLASAAFTANDVLNQPNPALLGFGLLWLVRSLYNLATEEIGGQDAAVLWGVWHACGRTGGQAPLHRILEEANKAASQANGPRLSDESATRCLQRLRDLGLVEPMGEDVWLLRESCRDQPWG